STARAGCIRSAGFAFPWAPASGPEGITVVPAEAGGPLSPRALEPERRPPRDVGAGARRAPGALDVLDHQFGAGEVAHAGRPLPVVHGVGQVADQYDVLAQVDELADAEGPAQHAHVQVDAADQDVVDAAGGQQVPHLLAVVGDGVAGGDLDGRVLPRPGV